MRRDHGVTDALERGLKPLALLGQRFELGRSYDLIRYAIRHATPKAELDQPSDEQAPRSVDSCGLQQPVVFGLRLLKDREVGIGVFPNGEQLHVRKLCLDLVPRESERPA